jgi:hypothetical protein
MKSILHLYFHSKILNWKGREMTEKEFLLSFFQWRIPKTLRYLVMREMEQASLIKIEKKKPMNIIHLNNYYFDEEKFKKSDFKDEDTKNGKKYIPLEM